MWRAITYVSSGLTLVAFIVAVGGWVYRSRILARERIIRLAPENDRAKLVENTLEFFSIDTRSLTRVQKYDLAIHQIHAKASRFRTTSFVVIFIALLAAAVSAFALWQSPNSNPIKQRNGITPSPTPSMEETSYLRGQVDDSRGNPLENAAIRIDEITGKMPMQTTTTGDGAFIVEGIPARIGDRVRVYVSKEGYQSDNVYIDLPGPLHFQLRKR